jgi:hypothetical protein
MNPRPPHAPLHPPIVLLGFVTDLLQTGAVTLSANLEPFRKDDLRETAHLLEKFHQWDALEMPLKAPAFDAQAALWAAHYVCRALQFVMVRNLGEELIVAHLEPYLGKTNAEAIYSADLCLRHLPTIFDFAQSLSPSDPLVANLKATALAWPFSAVGMAATADFEVDHPSLQMAYADRVLAQRDRSRARQPLTNLHLQAALGNHAQSLWPDFEALEMNANPAPIHLQNTTDAGTTDH